MTVQELIDKLNLSLKINKIKSTDIIQFRCLDNNNNLYHDVDYYLTQENIIILCKEWL